MSRLNELYITMENLRKLNLTIDDRLKGEAAKLEEDLIRQEILPVLTEKIEPALGEVQRELVLVVDYVPGEPLKVSLSRKRKIADMFEDVVEITPVRQRSVSSGVISRSESKDFTVRFADGTVISEPKGKDTMIEALRHIGFNRVANYTGRTFAGFPLVGHRRRVTEGNDHKWQEKVDGWWIYVNMSNMTKMQMIQEVAKMLGIKVKIEIDDDSAYGSNIFSSPRRQRTGKRSMFSLNGGAPMNKREAVYATVKRYLETFGNDVTFEDLEDAFPRSLQGSYGVIVNEEEIENRRTLGQQVEDRYAIDRPLRAGKDGSTVYVCTQWGPNFSDFQKHVAESFGWTLTEV